MEQLSGKQMDEKWFACKKFNIPNGRYELLSICEADSGLQIIFCDTKRHVKVFIQHSISRIESVMSPTVGNVSRKC